MQYYFGDNFEVKDNSVLVMGVSGDRRDLKISVIYLVVFCVSFLYLISQTLLVWKLRMLPALEEWEPVNK